VALPRVGRILADAERTARLADEAAASLPGEVLRTAFAISNRHVLTAWHCVRDDFRSGNPLWYRFRAKGSKRLYIYIPVRVSNYDEPFDAAALAVDNDRLSGIELTLSDAERQLADVAVPLAGNVSHGDNVILVGFPSSGSAADSDTNDGRVVDSDLALGEVVGIKIQGEAFGAVSPVDPHGLSGGPVLREVTVGDERDYAAVGIVRAAPRGIVSYASAGASVVASRLSDLVGLMPEVAVALSRGTARELATAVALSGSTEEGSDRSAGLDPKQSFLSISQECLKTLAEKAVRIPDPSRGELTGWAHFFDEPPEHLRPTAISTAYGLKIALTIDAPDGSLDRSRLTETLWKLRLSDGGWAARTGRDYSRPETTALVLGALASAGYDGNRLAEAGLAFEKALSRQADPVARSLVYPTCAGIRGLVRARPDSNRLPELRTSLLEGAISDSANRDLTCWASELASNTTTTTTLLPSVPHTAMAIVSLCRANLVLGPDEKTAAALDQAVAWLSQHPDFANKSEQIRRIIDQHDEQRDLLNINHFTAAWVARALLSVQPISAPETEALLLNAVRQVWLAQRGGVWNWEENVRPVWMTYQGLCVLRDYSMLRGLELLTKA
jgi:hypothetical protein